MLARDMKWFSRRQHPYSWTSFIREVSGTYYAVPGDKVIVCDTTDNSVTVFLPSAADAGRGSMITLKDKGNAATNNIILRGRSSSEKIDGANIVTLDTDWTSVPVVSDGKIWLIL